MNAEGKKTFSGTVLVAAVSFYSSVEKHWCGFKITKASVLRCMFVCVYSPVHVGYREKFNSKTESHAGRENK